MNPFDKYNVTSEQFVRMNPTKLLPTSLKSSGYYLPLNNCDHLALNICK